MEIFLVFFLIKFIDNDHNIGIWNHGVELSHDLFKMIEVVASEVAILFLLKNYRNNKNCEKVVTL